jgi:hypothetical protein
MNPMSRRSKHAAVLAFAVVAALWASPVAAQQAEDQALAAARELITVMRVTDQFKQIMPTIMQMLKPAFTQGRPPQVAQDFEVVIPVLLDGMSARVGEMTDELAAIYARNFTADEMRQMMVFYRTPVGQKVLEKMPSVAQQSILTGQAWGQRVGAELQARMIEELRKKGHDVSGPAAR